MNTDPSNPIGQRGEQGLVASDFYVMEIVNDAGRAGVDFGISMDYGSSWVISGMINGAGLTFPAGQWHHVAATYDGTQIQMYLDGQPSGLPTPASGSISPMRPTSFVAIGSEDGRLYCPECTANRYYHGLIDEADMFNRAVTATEIAAIYNPPQSLGNARPNDRRNIFCLVCTIQTEFGLLRPFLCAILHAVNARAFVQQRAPAPVL